ncbi:hypothetical protein ZOSMA_93G00100 [Zostera marina]|uniref:Glycolipid transfer protein domain-containing protein n=1 Tax=Zostera marina TaxID=29655 RepID=A0A0K9NIF5_ZOSMR|nr:hypothetical protein ZOSMA_93G00100 [Zostera marina]
MGDQINRLLLRMADAFDDLAGWMISQSQDLDLYIFAARCSTISPVFQVFRVAFGFMQKEYSNKVDHLIKVSETVPSIQAMIDQEIESKTVRHGGNTRSLLRVIRGLDVTRLFFLEYTCPNVRMFTIYVF